MQASQAPHAPMRQLLPRHRPAALLHGATGSLALRAHSTHKARCVVQPRQAQQSPANEKDTTSTRAKPHCDIGFVGRPKSGELQAPGNDGGQPKTWILLAALSAAMMAVPLNAGAAQLLATSAQPMERSVMSAGSTNTAPENGSDSVPVYSQRQYDEAAEAARDARIQEVSAVENMERLSFSLTMFFGAMSAAWFWFLFKGARQEVEPAATAAVGAKRKGTTTIDDVDTGVLGRRELSLFVCVYIGLVPLKYFFKEGLELIGSVLSRWH